MYDNKGDRAQAFFRGLLGAGQALSAAGAPSTMPRGLLAPIAAGGGGFLSGVNSYQQELAQRHLADMQDEQFAMQKQDAEAKRAAAERQAQSRQQLADRLPNGLPDTPETRMMAADAGYNPGDIFPKVDKPKPNIQRGADGFLYNLDTGQRALPNVQAPPDKPPEVPASVREIEYWQSKLEKLPPDSPSRPIIQARLAKLTSDSPMVSVNMSEGGPGSPMDPNVMGEYKTLRGQVNDFNKQIQQFSDIEGLVNAVPDNLQGAGAETLLGLQKWGQKLGFTDNITTAAQAEALRSKALEMSMAYIAQTKGAISNAEMQLFMEAAVNLRNTKVGNALIVKYAKRAAERQRNIAREMMGWVQQNPQASLFDYDRKLAEVTDGVQSKPFLDEHDDRFLSSKVRGHIIPGDEIPPGYSLISPGRQ